ncbi:MAG: hypothetical protein IR527_01600 [Bacteroides sp.]|nr:MAG: hypothetical protein IR527_01600 [Bacteroides sp.]
MIVIALVEKLILILILILIPNISFGSLKLLINDIKNELILYHKNDLKHQNTSLSLYLLGNIFLEEGNLFYAKKYFNKGLEMNSNSYPNIIGLLTIQDDKYDIDQLVEKMTLNYNLSIKDVDFNIYMMRYCYYLNDTNKLKYHYDMAVKYSKKNDYKVFIEKSKLYLQSLDYYNAINEIKKAMVYNNYDSYLYYFIGTITLQSNNILLSEYYLKKSIECDSKYPNSYHAMSIVQLLKKDYKNAFYYYNKYYEYSEYNNLMYEINIIKILLISNELDKSLNYLNNYTNLDKDTTDDVKRLKGYIFYKQKKYECSKNIIKNLIESNYDNNIEDYKYLIKSYMYLKKDKKVIKYLNIIDKFCNDNSSLDLYNFYFKIVKYYDSIEEYYTGILILQHKINLFDKHLISLKDDLIQLGIFMTYTFQYNKANNIFLSLLEKYDHDSFIYLMLAQINRYIYKSNSNMLSIYYYEQIINLFNKKLKVNIDVLSQSYRYLGNYYYNNNDLYNAKYYLNKLFALNYNDKNLYKILLYLNNK